MPDHTPREAHHSFVHLAPTALPEALADLHRSVAVGDRAVALLDEGRREVSTESHLRRVIEGAGFEVVEWGAQGETTHVVELMACRSLPDRVGPDLSLMICGLNPSPASSDSGVGFHKAGNRFWPAALAAGIVTVDRDPTHALRHHRVGMTDLVKRTTSRASEVSTKEFAAGIERLDALCEWLRPAAVCMVGLSGWRAGVDRKATMGWQAERLGGRPVYVMGSTSGLNAHETVDSLTEHFLAAASPPPD